MIYSYSSLSKFLQCPFLFNEQYVLKSIKYKKSDAADYGIEMHSAMENLIQGKQEFSPRYEFLRPVVNSVLSIPGKKFCEYELCFKQDWSECDWWAQDGFIKGKADLVIKHPSQPKILLKDWKFAKPDNTKYAGEMRLFSLLNFKKDPELQEVRTGLVWLKQPAPETIAVYKKSQESELEDEVLGVISRIEDAISFDNFPCKINGLCKAYCDATNCKHNGRTK